MPFTVPDKGEGLNDIQSIWFQEYIDVLVAGISGVDAVLSGCAVTAQTTPNMTVAVAAGSVSSNGVNYSVAAGNGTITTADATNPRLDLVVITSVGAIAVRAGTAAGAPKPAAKTANDVVLAVVFVPAGDTAINGNQIVDLRTVNTAAGPKLVTLGADVINNNATANTLQDVTGLSFPVLAGSTYEFEFVIPFDSAATTTGSRWALNGPALTSLVALNITSQSPTIIPRIMSLTAYETGLVTLGASLTENIAILKGIITCSAAGNVIARFASEIASSAITAKAGAYVLYRKR